MLFGLVSVSLKRGSNLRIKLHALGWVQILPFLPDQHLFSLAYSIPISMIQGWVEPPTTTFAIQIHLPLAQQ